MSESSSSHPTARPFWRTPSVWAGCVSAAIALVLAAAIRPGSNASSFSQFIGRFHPLIVHLPIGILLALALAESLTWSRRLRKRVDPVVGLVIPLLAGSAVASVFLGLLMAHSGGYPSRLVALHRGFTLAAVAGAALCALTWSIAERKGERWRVAYRAALAATVLLLSIGAHFGGSLSRGDDYLVHFAPAFVQKLLGHPSPTAESSKTLSSPEEEPRVFADVVLPVLRERCVECHGPSQAKKRLRLDSLAGLVQGGEGGPAVVAGKGGTSLLVERMTLPRNQDDHMPPDGKPDLSPEEIQLIRWWIDRGANESLRVRDGIVPDGARAILAHVATPESTLEPGKPAPSSPAAAPSSVAPAAASSPPAPGGKRLVFQDVVTPILSARCGKCHGESKQKGNLRVDTLAGLLAGGKSGRGVVPGDPVRSPILARVRLPLEHDEHMPPNNESQLAPSQIELLSWWIEHGASATITEEQLPPRLSHVAVSAAGPKVSREQQPAGSASAAATAPPLVASTNEAHPGRDERGVNLYRQVVAPILINRCGSCHTGSHVSGGLRVDDRASMVSEGDIVPGVADKSPLLTRMLLPASNPAHMPPSDKTQPAAAEMELIRTWIASGAKEDALVDPQDLPASVRALALAPPSTGTGTGDSGSESGKPADKARSMGPAPGHVAGCAACTVAHPDHDTDARGLWLSGLAATLLVTRYRRRPRLPQGSGSSGKCF